MFYDVWELAYVLNCFVCLVVMALHNHCPRISGQSSWLYSQWLTLRVVFNTLAQVKPPDIGYFLFETSKYEDLKTVLK